MNIWNRHIYVYVVVMWVIHMKGSEQSCSLPFWPCVIIWNDSWERWWQTSLNQVWINGPMQKTVLRGEKGISKTIITVNLPERQNYFTELPFNNLSDYNIENEYISTIRRLQSLLDNDTFQSFLKDNMYEEIFNAAESISCQYHDEDQFI